mmetsp:Transcript_88316/g.233639  ORF Transcript_88316/g.233639 Transcript_88316/m.233639 type:complete len:307 (-) Transcript_88316:210-1130(-)
MPTHRLQVWSTISILHWVYHDGLVMGAEKSKENGATVVIHVGPPKTASKTVQKELCDRTSLLARDGWTFLRPRQFGSMVKGSRGKIQVANVAACYTGYVFPYVINQTQTCLDWLEYIDKLRGTSHKVVMSSENFAQGQTPLLAQLASDLRHVTTKVIVVYRPFYDWIASVYRQTNAKRGISKAGFASWLTDSVMEEYAANLSSTSVYSKYAAHFSDVVMHSLDSSLLTNIACDDLGAPMTCASFRRSEMTFKNVKQKKSTGECLSPAQLQTLETISIDLHRKAFGILAPFPASDFHDQVSSCFGNR